MLPRTVCIQPFFGLCRLSHQDCCLLYFVGPGTCCQRPPWALQTSFILRAFSLLFMQVSAAAPFRTQTVMPATGTPLQTAHGELKQGCWSGAHRFMLTCRHQNQRSPVLCSCLGAFSEPDACTCFGNPAGEFSLKVMYALALGSGCLSLHSSNLVYPAEARPCIMCLQHGLQDPATNLSLHSVPALYCS